MPLASLLTEGIYFWNETTKPVITGENVAYNGNNKAALKLWGVPMAFGDRNYYRIYNDIDQIPHSSLPVAERKGSVVPFKPKTTTIALSRQRTSRPRILLITTLFNLSYRVLRCAVASGADVYVFGNLGAKEFRYSRYCQRFIFSEAIINGQRDKNLAVAINCLARELDIDTVLPGCAHSTRSLIASRDLIEPDCFPLPTLEQFDLLNDKWSFAGLCDELEIRHPATKLFPNAAALADELAAGGMVFPFVAKPLDWSGGGIGKRGIILFDGTNNDECLKNIGYEPILAQQFIKGTDVCASIYARAGNVEAFVANDYKRLVYSTFHNDKILRDVSKLAKHFSLDGVYNFDIVQTDNFAYYLECNPRFYFKLDLAAVAGVNFVEAGLRRGGRPDQILTVPDGVSVKQPKALLWSLLRKGFTRRDLAMLRHHLSDPVPYLLEGAEVTF